MWAYWPIGVLGLAVWAVSRMGDSDEGPPPPAPRLGPPPPGPDGPEFGAGPVTPFLVVAGGAAAESAAAAEVAASLGVMVAMAGLALQAFQNHQAAREAGSWVAGEADDLWSPESPIWKDSLAKSTAKVNANGLEISEDCAWILAPHTIFMRFAQTFWEAASKGGKFMPKEIGATTNMAMRKALERFGLSMSTEGALLLGESLPMRAIAETMVLISFFVDEILTKNPQATEEIGSAMRTTGGQLVACFSSVKASWPKKISNWFGRYIGGMALALRNLVTRGGKLTTRGGAQILFTVIVTTTVNLIINWMQDNDIDDAFFGESLDWWVQLFTGIMPNRSIGTP